MPYWICFLWAAGFVAAACCALALFEWLQEKAPEWVLVALTLILFTAILAVLPWVLFHK